MSPPGRAAGGEGVLHGVTATTVKGLRIAEQLQGSQEECVPGVELGCLFAGDGL